MRYAVRHVHSISQRCKCGHPRNGHHDLHVKDGSEWGHGPCASSASCDCMAFEADDAEAVELPQDVVEYGDTRAVAAMLRKARLLVRGVGLSEIRRGVNDAGEPRLVCFPRSGMVHSIIIERWTEPAEPGASGADVVTTAHHGIYRIRWLRNGYCYVTSLVNRALIAAYVEGRWDEKGRLPDEVRRHALDVQPSSETLGCFCDLRATDGYHTRNCSRVPSTKYEWVCSKCFRAAGLESVGTRARFAAESCARCSAPGSGMELVRKESR